MATPLIPILARTAIRVAVNLAKKNNPAKDPFKARREVFTEIRKSLLKGPKKKDSFYDNDDLIKETLKNNKLAREKLKSGK